MLITFEHMHIAFFGEKKANGLLGTKMWEYVP